jgi:2-oxoisovalerate dehydrogenase E1 component beta subunit
MTPTARAAGQAASEAASGVWFDDQAGEGVSTTSAITYLQALTQALDDELASDARVILLGEDIGAMGGAFRVTRGLIDKYGDSRVIDLPMAEAAQVGMVIGLAISGFRPILELQFADFISCAYDQLVNEAAKLHYRFGIAVPIVLRCPSGAGVGAGPFHSQSPEGIFAHVPGLKIVCPGTVQDAYDLLRSAVSDPNPVLFFEHKGLYRSMKGTLAQHDAFEPLGRAAVRHQGKQITVVTYGALVRTCLQVAEELSQNGIGVDLVDLRCLLPIDMTTVVESVRKTGRVAIIHEDTRTHGVGAEVAAQLAEEAFDSLDAPIVRLAPPDTPVPLSKPLEDAFLPDLAAVRNAITQCLER